MLIVGPSLQNHGIGGVTVHVQRLKDYLNAQGYQYAFKDYKSCKPWIVLKDISKAEIIHFHISNPVYLYILVMCSRILGKTTIMTLHGDYGRFNWLKNWFVRRSIKTVNVPIVINEKSYNSCKSFNKNLRLITAFIPPLGKQLLQKEIISLLELQHRNKKTVISTNAFNVSYDKDGNDTYGIDFLVKFFEYSEDMVLVVSDPSGNYHKKYAGLISESIIFVDYPHPYFELLKNVDAFVRNTSTDGDALSVKESLYLGLPTFCTDVVDRPEGVCTFKYSDRESFNKCLNSIGSKPLPQCKIDNGAEKLIELYKEFE